MCICWSYYMNCTIPLMHMKRIRTQVQTAHSLHHVYIMSNNLQSAYTNHILASAHEYGPTDTTTTLLQSVQKGRYMNVLDSYFIQLLQHNNMIINEQTLKESSQLYDL